MALVLDHLSKSFGGVTAVDDVTLSFEPGCITGLIGPNGAGKTTIFNLITGMLQPTGGTVSLDGRDITGLPPHRIAQLGIGRTFQHTRIFQDLSVVENAMLGLPQISEGLLAGLLWSRAHRRRAEEEAIGNLDFIGIGARAHDMASTLGEAEQKLLMFASLMGSGAATLLLDEPTAGVAPTSYPLVLSAIGRLGEAGKTIVLIEHNIDVIRGSCHGVVFLAEGRTIATGTVEEVEADPRLGAIYFGERDSDA